MPDDSLVTQVDDLRAEGSELHALLETIPADTWQKKTLFKNWTVWDVVAHLHFSDHMGLTTLRSSEDFKALGRNMREAGLPMREYTTQWIGELDGPALNARWRATFIDMCDRLAAADPEQRLMWAGPGMKPRMFITARQMETWAHGWEVYDLLGKTRVHHDRIKNIATIGVRTFGWTFANRKLDAPEPAPYVKLTAPSGALWEWNKPQQDNYVEGNAVDFCQVVTQVRNIADTALDVRGGPATAWMQIAQCFAGGPEDPPPPGSRG